MLHLYKKTAHWSTLTVLAFGGVVLNPFMFQGCFLRCPELKPYVHNTDQLSRQLVEGLSTPFTPSNDTGMLEITLTEPQLYPNYQYAYAVERTHDLNVVPVAYAMPSCQKVESPPQLDHYSITAKLSVVWIPTEGEHITLAQHVDVIGTSQGTLRSLGNTLTLKSQSTKSSDDVSWNLELSRYTDGYKLLDVRTSSADTPGALVVIADGMQITTFER